MLPRKYRLTKRSDFQKVLENGTVFQGRLFGLAVLKKDTGEEPRIGIIVSNKISKKAVDRNRIRRLVREAVREQLARAPKGTLLVFLAKKVIVGENLENIKRETRRLYEKAGFDFN